MLDELTTEVLVRRCRKRPPDEAAWQEFLRRYHSTITANVVKVFNLNADQELERRPQFHRDAIEDLVQTVYFRLIDDNCRVLKAFRGEFENSLKTYLTIISTNVVRDHFRKIKAGRRPKISFSLDELLEKGTGGELLKGLLSDLDGSRSDSVPAEIKTENIDGLLKKALTSRGRDRNILIFKLRYCDGLTLEEIRNTLALDITTKGVGSILSRINGRIKRFIEKKSRRNLK